MKLKPCEQWICDTCGGTIDSPGEGYVDWLCGNDGIHRDLRIVHHWDASPLKTIPSRCYQHHDKPDESSLSLASFLGPDGITQLLSMLDVGPYLEPDYRGPRIEDFREFVEVFRRLQVPYYEEARQYWSQAESAGLMEGANEISTYLQSTLKAMINTYQAQNCGT